jgi:hypothetical protein
MNCFPTDVLQAERISPEIRIYPHRFLVRIERYWFSFLLFVVRRSGNKCYELPSRSNPSVRLPCHYASIFPSPLIVCHSRHINCGINVDMCHRMVDTGEKKVKGY